MNKHYLLSVCSSGLGAVFRTSQTARGQDSVIKMPNRIGIISYHNGVSKFYNRPQKLWDCFSFPPRNNAKVCLAYLSKRRPIDIILQTIRNWGLGSSPFPPSPPPSNVVEIWWNCCKSCVQRPYTITRSQQLCLKGEGVKYNSRR